MECKKILHKSMGDFFLGLIQLIMLGCVLFLLSLTPIGNWLKCNFLDTQGCLPKFMFDIEKDESITFEKIKREYLKPKGWHYGNNPDNTDASECVKYNISIKNYSYKGRGSVVLKWSPIKTRDASKVFLSRYRLSSKSENQFKPIKKSVFKEFNILNPPSKKIKNLVALDNTSR